MEPSNLSAETDHAVYFRAFIHQLAEKFGPLQIFSFASDSLIQNGQGCFSGKQVSFCCNYCLLLVTESVTRIDYEVQDFANAVYRQGTVTIICHGKQSILEAVQANSRFYISVLTYGKLLYSHDGLLNIDYIQPFIPVKAALKAQKHFDHRMPLAEGFLMAAAECLEKGHYGICAFMLHQAVEQACIGLIRVYVAYRAEFHNLQRLLRLCGCFSDQPYKLFIGSPEDERLFDVLAKSYSAARYRDDFSVSRQDADSLYQRAVCFLSLAKAMCSEKIKQLDQEAALYSVFQQLNQTASKTMVSNEQAITL